jgi:hypothetical protein
MISSPLFFINCSWLSKLAAITFFNKLKNPETGFCSSFQSGKKEIIIAKFEVLTAVAEGSSLHRRDSVLLGMYTLTFQRITVPSSSQTNSPRSKKMKA